MRDNFWQNSRKRQLNNSSCDAGIDNSCTLCELLTFFWIQLLTYFASIKQLSYIVDPEYSCYKITLSFSKTHGSEDNC